MSEPTVYIEKLALIGVGLIGGSLVKSLRSHNAVGEVVGVGRSAANLQQAKALGVIDSFTHDVALAVQGAQMVVIAAPVGAFEQILEQMLPVLDEDAIVTDVGSVKGTLVETARRVMGVRVAQFVPAHPIAGGENSGILAARADLFIDHKLIITPLDETREEFISRVSDMWAITGSKITHMDVDIHDEVLAVTSHLPHVIAFALINYLAKQPNQPACDQFSAGGLYDLTRIASSDGVMWRDIMLNNKDNISKSIRNYARELTQLADHIDANKGEILLSAFESAKKHRARLTDKRKRSG